MTTAVAVRPPTIIETVRTDLDNRRAQIEALLGPSIPFDRFVTVALHAVNSNRDLGQCTPLSIVEAIREAAALRLEPTGLLGDAYIVKYGDKARLMPGYRGLMKIARRTGEVAVIDAQVVYAADTFDVDLGTDPRIVHRPTLEGDRGNYRGAYAWARLMTGELKVEWMTLADIEAVRKSSKASGSGPWVTFWGEMARKSALRRLLKQLPATSDIDKALELEAEAEQEPVRPPQRPRPAVIDVRARLGLPVASSEAADVEDEPNEPADAAGMAEAAAADVEDTTSPAPVAVARCEGFDVEAGACKLEAAHTGNHRAKSGESWK